MLEKIVVKNINSIDVGEIDFAKGKYNFGLENVQKGFVNPITIYGHNGSGKSSFLNALASFIGMMFLPPDLIAPFTVNNYLFDQYYAGAKDESLLKGSVDLFFDLNGKKFEYFIETSRLGYISYEFLKVEGIIYFENHKQNYVLAGKQYKAGKEFSSLGSSTSPLVPLLRILASNEISNPIIQTVSSYIRSFTHVNASFINRGAFVTSTIFNNTNLLDLLSSNSDKVRDLLRHYSNFPVYSIVKDNKNMPNGMSAPQYNVILEDGDFKEKLPIQFLSTGMQNQSTLLSLLLSMPKNSVMFIDEADIALHPSTIESFLAVIRERNIQVVMSLHNTFAMQSLRPDQIYFAKWSKGFSKLYRLSKIYPNIREINNIEKMYLSSLFDEAMEEHE